MRIANLLVALIFVHNTMAQSKDEYVTIAQSDALQKVLTKTVDGKRVFGTTYTIKQGNMVWQGSAGNLSADQPYFIASTTKLFTSALIFKLQSMGKLSVDDKIHQYLDSTLIRGLHMYKGKEYTSEITIRHLLSHTSGLPDYFQDKSGKGIGLQDELVSGKDRAWTLEESVERTKAIGALFIPGSKGKAHYSDANFQLLGRIIENVTGLSFEHNCRMYIIEPLGLNATYLYTDASDQQPAHMYYKNDILRLPKAMTSFGPDGGMVSTSADMLVFIEAFFTGKLFPTDQIKEQQTWNRIFPPMRSGMGLHQFKLPWVFNPTGAIPVYYGHSGLSGALAYYSPKHKLFIVGTVNQIANPDISFRTMVKLTQVWLRKK